MSFRPVFAVLAAVLTLAACNRDGAGGASGGADLDDIADAPVTDRAAYLEGYRFGEDAKGRDSTFNADAFLRGLREGYAADSAQGVPYLLGYQRGLELALGGRQDSAMYVDLDLYAAAFREGFDGDSIRLDAVQEQGVIQEMGRARQRREEEQQLAQLRQQAATDTSARAFLDRLERGQAEAERFLAANGRRDSVRTTGSGLQYIVRRAGQGARPTDSDRVQIAYRLSTPGGETIDQNPNGQPAELAMGQMIPGVTEALKDMRIGESRRLFIPPALGYGTMGIQGSPIGPNQVLVFDVTLVDVLSSAMGGPGGLPGAPQ